jgi:hypothetical protein
MPTITQRIGSKPARGCQHVDVSAFSFNDQFVDGHLCNSQRA